MEKKLKILFVDDDKTLLEMWRIKFEQNEFTVFLAENGKEGLKQFKAHNPDILLVDIMMPVMDGFEMLKELRQMQEGAEVPVLMLTNKDESKDVLQSAKAHVDYYLVKANYTPEELVKKVRRTIKERARVS